MKTLQCSDCSPGAHFPPQCPTNDMFVCNTICFLFLFLPLSPHLPLLFFFSFLFWRRHFQSALRFNGPRNVLSFSLQPSRSADAQGTRTEGGRGQVQAIAISLPAKILMTNTQNSILVTHRKGCFEICPPEGRVC